MRPDCCYYECPEQGEIDIGKNGGDSHWICFRHYDSWSETRARLLNATVCVKRMCSDGTLREER
jgi:hypothetical protein